MQLALRYVFEDRETSERNCIVTSSRPWTMGSQDGFGSFYDSLTGMKPRCICKKSRDQLRMCYLINEKFRESRISASV